MSGKLGIDGKSTLSENKRICAKIPYPVDWDYFLDILGYGVI